MGQKTNPIANRLGIIRGWDSNWYGGTDYAGKIFEDARIRKRSNHVTIVLDKKTKTVKEEQ